ncbi:MAG: hypothetical protein JWN46_1369 [Acidimicrobiales bacterium]|nr:hypothetical protein [Acidimicrobiales bacterium]
MMRDEVPASHLRGQIEAGLPDDRWGEQARVPLRGARP